MVNDVDPVSIGLVASLARPGGNLTGISLMSEELSGKRLQLLKEAIARLERVAVLWNARSTAMTNIFSAIQTAATVLGVPVQPLGVQEATDIVNLKTAKALGITIPPSLVMLADKVIE